MSWTSNPALLGFTRSFPKSAVVIQGKDIDLGVEVL
jgi:hypothetical protein